MSYRWLCKLSIDTCVNPFSLALTVARLTLSAHVPKAKMVGKRSPFTDQIRSYIKNRSILGIQAKEVFNETKQPLYANIWNIKRLSSFHTLLICQILPLVTFSYSQSSKTPRWKKISNAQKSRFDYFSLSEQYTLKRLWKRIWKLD